jgi:hypothetical protein
MERHKIEFCRAALILLGCSSLTACANGFDALGRPARADPHMAAVYHGDEERFDRNAKTFCPLTRAIDDSNYGAVNLDCFRFPEDTQALGKHEGNKDDNRSGLADDPLFPNGTTKITRITTTTTPVIDPGKAAKKGSSGTTSGATNGRDDPSGPPSQTNSVPTTSIKSTIERDISVPGNPTAYALSTVDLDSRNRLTQILVNQSDSICTVELGRLEGRVATFNLAGDIATSGFAGAASIVGGNTAKSILAGIASFTSATKDHFNADLLHSQMTEALIQAIRIEREKELVSIQSNYSKSVIDWPIDTAIQQVNAYNQVCSFYRGMELVLEAVQNGKSAAKDTPTAATSPASPSPNIAEIRLEYYKIDEELKATKVASERQTLLTERTTLQKMIDDALAPAKPATPAEQVTLAVAPTTPAPAALAQAPATPTAAPATAK